MKTRAKPKTTPLINVPKRDMSLTARERDVLKGFAYGKTYNEMAEELGLSSKTIGSYLQRVREKIRAKGRSDLIQMALSLGLLKQR